MGFQSKTYSLSDEVVEAIEQLRKRYGSPNKAFTAILLQKSEISPDKKVNIDKQVDVGDSFGAYPGRNRHLDAVGPKLSDGIGKISDSVVKDLKYEPDKP